MNRSVNQIITVLVICTIGYNLMELFSAGTPTVASQAISNPYIDATGREISLADYAGEYLWVDYAAAWCSYCESQTRTLKGLEGKYGDRVAFLTVVTGTGKLMEPPTADTAMAWAERFNLDPRRVLAYFSTNTLPYHILYSPAGKILYQGSGLYHARQITDLLRTHTPVVDD